MSTGVITPPPKKLNAASQFRKKRVLNALLSPNDVTNESLYTPHGPTPTRTLNYTPLPENNRSHLLDALEMAARPSHSVNEVQSNVSTAVEQPSASSSKALYTSLDRQASSPHSTPRRTTKIGLFGLFILLSFLMCESLLGVLILSQQEVRSILRQYVHDFVVARMVWNVKDTDVVKSESYTLDSYITDNNNEVDSTMFVVDQKREIETLVDVDSLADDGNNYELELKPPSQRNIDPYGELPRLESALEMGFKKLIFSGDVLDKTLERKAVDSLCGKVWSATNAIMRSAKYLSNSSVETREIIQQIRSSGTTSHDDLSPESELQALKSLAFEAQSCLGGAGLSFLSLDEIDNDWLRMSTKIFSELSSTEPSNADVRAGLGTSLLIQGLFYQDAVGREGGEKNDNVQTSLLSLAAHYLKMALSISDATESETTSHAAILHYLALAYTALGDDGSAVPILLRATTSCGREHFVTTKPYWNVPGDLLQIMEKNALVIGAAVPKKSHNKKSNKKRIPFLPFHEDLR